MHPITLLFSVILLTVVGITAILLTAPKTNETYTPVEENSPLANALTGYSDDIENVLNNSGLAAGEYKGLAWFYETCDTQLCQYLPHDIELKTSINGNNRHACYEITVETLRHKQVRDYDNPDSVTDQRIQYWIHQPQYYKSKLCFDIYGREPGGVY